MTTDTDTHDDSTTAEQQQDGGESLDALASEALSLDTQPEQEQQAEKTEQKARQIASNSGELLAALMMARTMALPILPRHQGAQLRVVWSDEVLQETAKAGAEVMALHDLQLGDLMGRYMPYVVLFGTLAGPVMQTREILTAPDPRPEKPAQGVEVVHG